MDNRRNHYRILRVQPDAAHEVIQQSYRSLMQKLRLHPDLGGKHRDARSINQAYAALRNPGMRAAYNAELFSQYSIKILSSGGLFSSSLYASAQDKIIQHKDNQRNYYRILHVQFDAELEIIKASYRILSGLLSNEKQPLLDEAFLVIGNTKRRLQYNTLLRLYAHVTSVEKLKDAQRLTMLPGGNLSACSATEYRDNFNSRQAVNWSLPYQVVINKRCCKFCKMPYANEHLMEQERFCRECASPLFSPADNFINAPRRSLPRMHQSMTASIYSDWPGKSIQVLLEDLSPMGVNFSAPQLLDINQLIKMDAPHFRAVAKIVYCRNVNSINNIGASFLTVEFFRTTGSFLSTSA